jgi:rubrerythrin
MSDDLFEFLAAQEMGHAAEVARRATEEAQVPAKVPSIIDKIKGRKRNEYGQQSSGTPD